MTARARLPTRRQCDRFSFQHYGILFHGTFGIDPEGVYCEVFLQGGKSGSGLEAIARDTAVFASLAMQYGAPLEVLRAAVTRLDDGTAAGPGGKMLDEIAEAET